jgi:hypothetical protein
MALPDAVEIPSSDDKTAAAQDEGAAVAAMMKQLERDAHEPQRKRQLYNCP